MPEQRLTCSVLEPSKVKKELVKHSVCLLDSASRAAEELQNEGSVPSSAEVRRRSKTLSPRAEHQKEVMAELSMRWGWSPMGDGFLVDTPLQKEALEICPTVARKHPV